MDQALVQREISAKCVDYVKTEIFVTFNKVIGFKDDYWCRQDIEW